jgi:hypothetical protein
VKQYIILVLIATAYLVVSELDYRDKVAESQEKTQKYIKLLATAMNGGAILDKHTDTAYFFDKPTIVRLNK